MTGPDRTGDGDEVLTLQAVIRARMDERGWSYADLAHRTGDALTRSRWQQLGTGARLKAFPEVGTIRVIARALEIDETAVVLSVARSLDLDVRRRGTDLGQLLPTGTDRLTDRMRDAILAMIRAAVAETLAREDEDDESGHGRQSSASVLEWTDTPGRRRNATSRTNEQ